MRIPGLICLVTVLCVLLALICQKLFLERPNFFIPLKCPGEKPLEEVDEVLVGRLPSPLRDLTQSEFEASHAVLPPLNQAPGPSFLLLFLNYRVFYMPKFFYFWPSSGLIILYHTLYYIKDGNYIAR